ncbi:anthranilate phosphoribosyltransferase, partial [Physocladia obscura]
LGPLTNPARPSRMIVGVYDKEIGPIMAESLHLNGVKRAWIVHGELGLDEIAPSGDTLVWSLDNETGAISHFRVHPTRDFGLREHPLDHVRGGDAAYNSATMIKLLGGALSEHDPVLDFVLMNAAALLFVAGVAVDLKDGVGKARESIYSGSAKKALDAY